MSAFMRTMAPPVSPNPLQTFVTLKQALWATKGASIVAVLVAGLGAWTLLDLWSDGLLLRLAGRTSAALVPGLLLTLAMAVLAWRIWVRPGPWKTFAVLAFVVCAMVRLFVGFAELTPSFVATIAILALALNACLISFRAALAMKRLRRQADLDVF